MRHSNLENHLTHLDSPNAPADLRARCLATVPQSVPKTKPMHTSVWRAQRFAFAGGLLLATAVGSAFWSTRPASDSGNFPSGGMALAQTLKAMANIEAFHMIRKDRINAAGDNWRSSHWRQLEAWVDTKRGAFAAITPPPYTATNLPPHLAKVAYTLLLPNGTSYERANERLVISKRTRAWTDLKATISPMLLGSVAITPKGAAQARNFYNGGQMKLQSTQVATWKGKQAQLFVMKAPTSRDNPYAPPTMRKIYVDRNTNLVMASQDFVLFKNGAPSLMSQEEFDYKRPDASLFEPQRLKAGATEINRKP